MTCCLEAANIAVRPAPDLHAVVLEIADPAGDGIVTLLGPGHAAGLIAAVSGALAELAGDSREARSADAQALIELLVNAGGLRQREIARRLRIGDSGVSLWRRGRQLPTPERLRELRRLVRRVLPG